MASQMQGTQTVGSRLRSLRVVLMIPPVYTSLLPNGSLSRRPVVPTEARGPYAVDAEGGAARAAGRAGSRRSLQQPRAVGVGAPAGDAPVRQERAAVVLARVHVQDRLRGGGGELASVGAPAPAHQRGYGRQAIAPSGRADDGAEASGRRLMRRRLAGQSCSLPTTFQMTR